MNIESFREYCLAKPGVTESFPFDEHTLVFKVMNKMFALTGLERTPFAINLKCDPERTVTCEGDLPTSFVRELVDHSYELVVASLPKKVRAELDEES